jgi:hypothetical protein
MLPIAKILGSLFSILGLFLFLFGMLTYGDAMYIKSLGININLYWGLFMLLFGGFFIYFGRKGGALN